MEAPLNGDPEIASTIAPEKRPKTKVYAGDHLPMGRMIHGLLIWERNFACAISFCRWTLGMRRTHCYSSDMDYFLFYRSLKFLERKWWKVHLSLEWSKLASSNPSNSSNCLFAVLSVRVEVGLNDGLSPSFKSNQLSRFFLSRKCWIICSSCVSQYFRE